MAEPRFADRPTRFVGLDERRSWRLKRYEITADGAGLADEIAHAVDAVVDGELAQTPLAPSVGFVIVHVGLDAVWLLVDLWQDELLYQSLFRSDLASPNAFVRVGAEGPTACVWELRVVAHERDAYVRSSREREAAARADMYLAATAGAIVPHARSADMNGPRELIEAFNERWAAGDVDGLIELFAESPEYRASTGPGPGEVHRGRDNVRAAIERVIAAESADGCPPPGEPIVLIDDDRGMSSWSYMGRDGDGRVCVIEGVDVWTFERGRIKTKDAYRKALPGPFDNAV